VANDFTKYPSRMKELILSLSCNTVKILPESKEIISLEKGHIPKNNKSMMSQFPEEVVKKAFLRANSRCQCERDDHDHGTFTCFKQIIWEIGETKQK